MAPLIVKKKIALPLPSDDDRRADDQRIKDTLGLVPLAIPLSVLKKVSAQIKKQKGGLSCIVGHTDNGYKLIDISSERSYSLALDLGTTNLVFLLYDNVSQQNVLSQSFENPQIAFGSDILTRMHHAMSARADEVYGSLKEGINRALRTLCEKAGIATDDVHAFVVAGNTVMSHFFLGLDISTIPVDPFVPVVRTPGFFAASELALDINPEALVYVFPNAGSYVGGDIVAGIIASGIHRSNRISVLIDVGTNAEVVIGNKDWMLVGAGAAGPALEEGITRIGKRASKGIIYDIEIKGGSITCKTFDEHAPQGICGSGMVSLLFELYNAGTIDKSGVLNLAKNNVAIVEGEPAYAIVCGCGDALYIRQSEIQNFMKSKAAMFTLLLVLVRSVGIGFKDIASVFVSGALGTGIDANKAVAIGMLPAWPAEIVKPLGNTSLEGARLLLVDSELVQTIDAVTAKITYKHMHDDPEFMKEYLGAVFIPHTNPELLKAT
jgi:uncharacterized 2Fe-2S/4Fe-4S cluster protein (DUF4445 family)